MVLPGGQGPEVAAVLIGHQGLRAINHHRGADNRPAGLRYNTESAASLRRGWDHAHEQQDRSGE